jgi:hypothetical protein
MKLFARTLIAVALLTGCTNGARHFLTGAAGAGAGSTGSDGTAGVTNGGASGNGAGVGGVGDAGASGNGVGGGAAGQTPPESDAGGVDSAAGVDSASEVGPGGDGAVGGCSGVFCEDFESGQIDPAIWSTPSIGGATMTVQTKTVAHGKYAVQFHGPANPAAIDYVYIITKAAPASLQKHNFGRAYMYISPQRNDIDMGLIFGGTAGFPRPTYMSIANHSTGWQFGFIKLMGSPGGEVQTYPPGDIPVAKWTCLEWEFNDDPDEINVWGDGTLIGTLNKDSKIGFCSGACTQPASLYNSMNSGLIGAFTDFGFGFYDWHQAGRPAFDLYYDDIVLSTERVGCLQ